MPARPRARGDGAGGRARPRAAPARADAGAVEGVVALPVARPFPWRALLAYLASRLTPGVEAVSGDHYRRRIGDDVVEVSLAADGAALRIEGACAAGARERVAALFAVDFDGAPAAAVLARDPLLRARLVAVPGVRPLGAFAPFELCVRTIVGQQVTVAAAGTLMRRLVERCGGTLAPQAVADADLAAIGMPGRRAECLRALAAAVAGGRVDLAAPWRELDAALGALPGIGPWTRAYLAIRLGREPDAFPAGDLGLQRAAGAASARALAARAETWRPHRALAATLLWCVPPPVAPPRRASAQRDERPAPPGRDPIGRS